MEREIWKEIGRRGGNKIRMDDSCGIGDRMRQQKHTLEERSRRLQNKRERAIQRRSQETSEERSCRLQNARDRQSQRGPRKRQDRRRIDSKISVNGRLSAGHRKRRREIPSSPERP